MKLSKLSKHKTRRTSTFATIINYIAPIVFEFITDCTSHEEAIAVLKRLYVKSRNNIYARHVLVAH